MHYISLVSTTLLASAAASAIPGTSPITVDKLTKRAEKVWDPKGNIKLTFSSETIQIGDLKLDDIIGKLGEVCHESGQCETNDLTLKSTQWSADSNPELKITLGPDGTYPTWIRNGLIDTLGRSIKAVAKCKEVTYTNKCFGTTAMAYCPQKKSKHTNCEVPKFWGINFQSPDVANAAPPALALDLQSERTDGEVCKTALETTGTVAGAVNGYAGSIFTLLSLACV
ncbi:hypothetical protein IQ06DRAFT_135897 [Phaeosphaeriaceae sp. SRC1lsM3a]|nr:hypothetical protein IQ06DRAFT_135897 [Stagonospora sp. SRC1lsM3a]